MEPYSKNRRNNTSLLIRYLNYDDDHSSNSLKNILIDCGKTFYQSVLQWFPKYHVHTLDAVILTHEHADAAFGLDELREWSMPGKPLNVYLSRDAYVTIRQTFPYLTDPRKATGGGEVSILNFITFEDQNVSTVLDVCGLSMLPIRVVHGERTIFDRPIRDNSDTPETPEELSPPSDIMLRKAPFYAFGYRFEDIVYMSDVSLIPEESIQSILGSKILIVDALHDLPGVTHQSHFSVQQALESIDELDVGVGILTGLGHTIEHHTLQHKLDQISHEKNRSLLVAYDGMVYDVFHMRLSEGIDDESIGDSTLVQSKTS